MEKPWMIMILLSPVFAQVQVLPSGRYRSVPGGDAIFTCLSHGHRAIRMQWLINGRPFENQNLENVTEEFHYFSNSLVGTLSFTNLHVNYNRTRIRCKADLMLRPSKVTTRLSMNNVTLLIFPEYRPLVADLTPNAFDSTIFLNWTVPNISGINPNISGYCVNVVDEASNIALSSTCEINETEYIYPIPPRSWCSIYIFTVYIANSSGNAGEQDSKLYQGTHTPPEVIQPLRTMKTEGSNIFNYSLTMTAPVCTGDLIFVDLDTGEIITGGNNDLTIDENIITFTTKQLTLNHRYNDFVSARNIAGSATSIIEISTHNVVGASVVENNNGIEVTIINSDARGALFNFVFTNNTYTQSTLVALNVTSSNYILPFELFSGLYIIFVHDIEYDGTLSNGVGYPAVTTTLITVGDSQASFLRPALLYIRNCFITTEIGLIMAKCTYPSNSSAVGFQLLAQLLSDSTMMYKLYINQTWDRQTPTSVLVEESGTYQVTIFAIREGIGIVGTDVEYIKHVPVSTTTQSDYGAEYKLEFGLSIGFGSLVAILVVFVIFLLMKVYRCHKKHTVTVTVPIPNDGELVKSASFLMVEPAAD